MSDFIIENSREMVITELLNFGQHVLVTGQSGSGKTSLCKDIAGKTNREAVIINCGSTQDARSSLIGNFQLHNGNTSFIQSEFLKALQTPNALIVLDEVSRCSDAAMNILLPVLDFRKSIQVEETNEVIHIADGVRFMATANIGRQYSAARSIDKAFLDRFIQFNLEYISGEELVTLLNGRVKGLDSSNIQEFTKLTKVYDHVNEGLMKGNFATGISPRTMIPCALLITKGISSEVVFNNVLLSVFQLDTSLSEDVRRVREFADTVGLMGGNNATANISF